MIEVELFCFVCLIKIKYYDFIEENNVQQMDVNVS